MISTRGRYALRVLIDLAERDTDGYTPLKDTAKRQDVSEKYLQQIVKSMVDAGLVAGASGKGGGYKLLRKPSEYPIGEVLELTEGTLAPVACLAPDAEPCDRRDSCKTLPMWQKIDEMTHDYLASITVADLIDGTAAFPE